jgi:ubiquitin-like 1-activating enzyme E1 B
VKRPKALVAKETASKFNPNVHIEAIHGNIKEPQYAVEWFKSFDLVTNALDNLGVSTFRAFLTYIDSFWQMHEDMSIRCA